VDTNSATIFYWGDAKFDSKKKYNEFKGNKTLLEMWHYILDGNLDIVPPILHFSKHQKGKVTFNGLCVLSNCQITWFEDEGRPIKNLRFELSILDEETVNTDWLHHRMEAINVKEINNSAPLVWTDYLKGNIRKLDIWSKSILSKEEQLPALDSEDDAVLNQLWRLNPTEFEAVVVDLFKNLPHVSHKITRTRPTADGGFDFFGEFIIPHPIGYKIPFLGEVKKFDRNSAVQPKHVSRLVARLNRGQFGIFVTTSYFTKQTQREVIEDGYPVKLFTGADVIKMLHELRLIINGRIKEDWLESVVCL
jgi:HJR/Mrr/RecB family endonuclease